MFSCFFMCSFPFSVYTNWIHLKNLFDYPGCFNTRRIVFQQTARPFSPAAVPCRSGWFPHELCFKKNSFLNSDDDVASISHPEKRRSRFCCPKCFQSSRVFRSYLFSISPLVLVCLNATLHLQSWV